jgi:hypothetical protein
MAGNWSVGAAGVAPGDWAWQVATLVSTNAGHKSHRNGRAAMGFPSAARGAGMDHNPGKESWKGLKFRRSAADV